MIDGFLLPQLKAFIGSLGHVAHGNVRASLHQPRVQEIVDSVLELALAGGWLCRDDFPTHLSRFLAAGGGQTEQPPPPIFETAAPLAYMTVVVVPGANVGIGAAQVSIEERNRKLRGTVVHIDIGAVRLACDGDLNGRHASASPVIEGIALVIDCVVALALELLALPQDLPRVRLQHDVDPKLLVSTRSLHFPLDGFQLIHEIQRRSQGLTRCIGKLRRYQSVADRVEGGSRGKSREVVDHVRRNGPADDLVEATNPVVDESALTGLEKIVGAAELAWGRLIPLRGLGQSGVGEEKAGNE